MAPEVLIGRVTVGERPRPLASSGAPVAGIRAEARRRRGCAHASRRGPQAHMQLRGSVADHTEGGTREGQRGDRAPGPGEGERTREGEAPVLFPRPNWLCLSRLNAAAPAWAPATCDIGGVASLTSPRPGHAPRYALTWHPELPFP